MAFEPVHTIRDFYDGIRSGLADFGGRPHYFESRFDPEIDDWSDRFTIYTASPEFAVRERRHHEIFLEWNVQVHQGLASQSSHPGRGGINPEYDDLERWLNDQIKMLMPLESFYAATFRVRPGQEDLPIGVWRQFEVEWREVGP